MQHCCDILMNYGIIMKISQLCSYIIGSERVYFGIISSHRPGLA